MPVGLSRSALSYVLRLTDAKPAAEVRWKYCRGCGSLIPFEATYCPNCGVQQETAVTTPEEAKPRGRMAEVIATQRKRIRLALFLASLGVFVAAFLLGSVASLSLQDAKEIEREFMDIYGRNPSATLILRNNVTLCLLFLVPVFGTALMAFVGYSTGTVLSALALVYKEPSALLLALATLGLPWAWMEFTAYSLASSEGMMIIVALVGRTLRREAKTFLIVLAASVALLVLGALVEVWVIRSAMAG